MTFTEKTAIAAVIGGTAEAVGGEKFANGAVSGAYVMMLNHLGHPPQTRPGRSPLTKEQLEVLKDKIKMATFKHRASWAKYDETMSAAPYWEVSLDIEGVEYDAVYTAKDVEIWLGKESLTVDIDYSPNKVHIKVNMIDEYGVDYSVGGRVIFKNNNYDGNIIEIKFRNWEDFDKYNGFIRVHN